MCNLFNRIKDVFGLLILFYFRCIKKLFILFKRRIINSCKKSVIVRMDAIGDFILSMDAINKIAEYEASLGNEVTLICNKCCDELVGYLEFIDEIIIIDFGRYKKEFLYRIRENLLIRHKIFSRLYNIQYSRNMWLEILVSNVIAIDSFAFDGNNFLTSNWRKSTNKFYTDIYSIDNEVFEIDKNISYVNYFLGTNYSSRIFPFDIYSNRINRVVIFPGGSYLEKSWEYMKFSQLIDYLSNSMKAEIFLCGTFIEEELVDKICRETSCYCEKYVGKSFKELMKLISSARLVIGNDSMGIHLSMALKIDTVVIAGGWQRDRFLNYKKLVSNEGNHFYMVRKNRDCFGCESNNRGNEKKSCGIIRGKGQDPYKCISSIEVMDVINIIEKEYLVNPINRKWEVFDL